MSNGEHRADLVRSLSMCGKFMGGRHKLEILQIEWSERWPTTIQSAESFKTCCKMRVGKPLFPSERKC